jgi:predicted DNA-binding transcriptional regulator AlpA
MSSALLDTAAAAQRCGLSVSTLEKFRCRGGGPKYVKIGRRTLYREADIASWLEERVFGSTSEYPAGAR